MRTDLFRPEVLVPHQSARFGQAVFYQPLSVRLMVISLLLLFVCFVVFAANADVKQTQRVRGHLSSSGGDVKVYAGTTGVLTGVLVKSGDFVEAGAVLATVSDPHYDQGGRSVAQLGMQQLDLQLRQLQRRMDVVGARFKAQESQLHQQIIEMEKALILLTEEQEILRRRVVLAEQDHAASDKLYQKKTISQREYRQSASALYLLQQQQKAGVLAIARHRQAMAQAERELGLQPLLAQEEKLVLENTRSQLQVQQQELESRRRSTIIASRDGVVSNLVLRVGDVIDPGDPLLTLLHTDAELEALLYLPSSALARVGEGAEVMISYDAYPYQTYGSFPAQILSVADSVMDPREFMLLVDVREPVYLVRARIADQEMRGAAGRSLRPGMQFFADIVTGEQTLMEKLLSPLTGLGSRL